MSTNKSFKQLDRQLAIVNRINIYGGDNQYLRRRKSIALALINQITSAMQDQPVNKPHIDMRTPTRDKLYNNFGAW